MGTLKSMVLYGQNMTLMLMISFKLTEKLQPEYCRSKEVQMSTFIKWYVRRISKSVTNQRTYQPSDRQTK